MSVPDVTWEYWGWANPPKGFAGLYGMDERRSECHERLCEHYGLDRDQTLQLTDNLDRFEDGHDLHMALVRLAARNVVAGRTEARGSAMGLVDGGAE